MRGEVPRTGDPTVYKLQSAFLGSRALESAWQAHSRIPGPPASLNGSASLCPRQQASKQDSELCYLKKKKKKNKEKEGRKRERKERNHKERKEGRNRGKKGETKDEMNEGRKEERKNGKTDTKEGKGKKKDVFFCPKDKERGTEDYLYIVSAVSSVQFSRSVVSESLRPNESQYARPPCPSPTPGVHSNSRPLSR